MFASCVLICHVSFSLFSFIVHSGEKHKALLIKKSCSIGIQK